MEIPSQYSYYTARLAPEPEDQTTGSLPGSQKCEAKITDAAAAEDRLEMVRAQNLASPAPEPVDLTRAMALLGQVQEQLQGMGKQEARELFQFDRLRDVLYRVAQTEGA